ncbi:hypothetical protein KUTeg_002534 [Tegillarca granosa]|uniref:CobW/HypB/UreG nucleotide-binding domain-containing protein n=1 Tax=Tegillarca granosa TaxID=220873 RepID=A0ABQ9FUJ9_TEGGR|nr:hypothetical protein KUTeg_002534 [Tegillarca granosa]
MLLFNVFYFGNGKKFPRSPEGLIYSEEKRAFTVGIGGPVGSGKIGSGDKIPRKGGPGITQSDLLVINKTDLAEAVGADLKVMERDAKLMRQDGPIIFAQAKHNIGVAEIAILDNYNTATG